MRDDRLDAARGVVYAVRLAFWFWLGVLAVGLMMYSCASKAAEWDTTEKVMFGSFVALEVVDAAQTRKIHKHPDQYQETNPLFGRDPNMAAVVGFKAAATGLVYWAAKDAPHADRKLLLGILDAVQVSIVAHNYSVGLKLGF